MGVNVSFKVRLTLSYGPLGMGVGRANPIEIFV